MAGDYIVKIKLKLGWKMCLTCFCWSNFFAEKNLSKCLRENFRKQSVTLKDAWTPGFLELRMQTRCRR